jgi:large subunit ribosomal protein L17
MLANMACSLIVHEQIVTTLPKARIVRPYIEKLITLSKKRTLHARRLALGRLQDDSAVQKLFSVLGERYENRSGGYSRVLKYGFRKGDNAPLAIIELVGRSVSAKGKEDIQKMAHEIERLEKEVTSASV